MQVERKNNNDSKLDGGISGYLPIEETLLKLLVSIINFVMTEMIFSYSLL